MFYETPVYLLSVCMYVLVFMYLCTHAHIMLDSVPIYAAADIGQLLVCECVCLHFKCACIHMRLHICVYLYAGFEISSVCVIVYCLNSFMCIFMCDFLYDLMSNVCV